MSKPVCVIFGIGPQNGAAFARKFAGEGHRLALCSRRTELSETLAHEFAGSRAYSCDVSNPEQVAVTLQQIRSELGPPETLIYNAGSGVWKTVDELSVAEFEHAFRISALGLFVAAQQVLPGMVAAGRGNIIVVGATASLRGRPKTAAFAAGKAAQRSLLQSIARQFGPQGVHVALLIIDGTIAQPGAPADDPQAKQLRPEDIAAEAFHLTRQPRSAWTFELDLRPHNESW